VEFKGTLISVSKKKHTVQVAVVIGEGSNRRSVTRHLPVGLGHSGIGRHPDDATFEKNVRLNREAQYAVSSATDELKKAHKDLQKARGQEKPNREKLFAEAQENLRLTTENKAQVEREYPTMVTITF